MREILFRGKRLDNNEWLYGGYHFAHNFSIENHDHFISYYGTFGGFTDNTFIKIDKETLGQFTGRYDKTYEKIFEGDIVVFENNKGVVKCGEQTFEFYLESDFEPMVDRFKFNHTDNFEVISNIHDDGAL